MSATKVCVPKPSLTFDLTKEEQTECKSVLSKNAMVVAEKELRETALGKEQALTLLREWISKNPKLINVRLDDNFLLRFLRIRKYNVSMAEHNLIKYLNFRQSISELSFNLDYTEGKVSQLIDDGYMFVSPFRDSHGRRVIIHIAEKMNPNKYTKLEMAKIHLITYETLLEDEENQVVGLTHFGDIKEISMNQVAMWSPLEMAVCLRIGEQAIPLRHKAIHIINHNSAFKFLVDFASSRVSQKIKDRLMLHSSMSDLHKNLDARCLPKEYGGVMPMAEMIDLWKKEIAASRSRLLKLDTMKSLVPIRKRTQVEEMVGSFKKLEVD